MLVGGSSSRMKSPKAHLYLEDRPLWLRAQEALAKHCEQVFFSSSPKLTQPIPVSQDLIIHDTCEPCGPLGGILSAFKHKPESAWFILACDIVYFTSEAANYLINQRDINKLATCYHDPENKPEPLCAIYEPAIINFLLEYNNNNINCPRKILSKLNINYITPKNYKIISNINYNYEWENLSHDYCEITIKYYASLRESRGCSEEKIFTKAKTIGELFNKLAYKYNFTLNQNQIRFAKNDELVSFGEKINNKDTIVFIPPVSGG